jgi:CI repressor-like protein
MERAIDLAKAAEKFGGFSELARRLEVPLSTCHGWKRRKKIPSWRQSQMIALATEEKVDIFKKKKKRGRRDRRAS